MLRELFNLAIVGTQMLGLVVLAIGCLFVVGAIFSGRMGGFVKGAALILIGGYLAGFGASFQ